MTPVITLSDLMDVIITAAIIGAAIGGTVVYLVMRKRQ